MCQTNLVEERVKEANDSREVREDVRKDRKSIDLEEKLRIEGRNDSR